MLIIREHNAVKMSLKMKWAVYTRDVTKSIIPIEHVMYSEWIQIRIWWEMHRFFLLTESFILKLDLQCVDFKE